MRRLAGMAGLRVALLLLALGLPWCGWAGDCAPAAGGRLSVAAAPVAPGTWLAVDALAPGGPVASPMAPSQQQFQTELQVGPQHMVVSGFLDQQSSAGGSATVLVMVPLRSGYCVIAAWQSAAGESFIRLSQPARWRAADGKLAVLTMEMEGPRSGVSAAPFAARTLAITLDGQCAWLALDTPRAGLALDDQAPASVALLGAGPALPLDPTTHRFATPVDVPAGGAGASPSCPLHDNLPLEGDTAPIRPGQWLADDTVARLYPLWPDDPEAQVVFRRRVGKAAVEVVGIAGADALVAFLHPAATGYCVLNVWYRSFGGNGASMYPPRWWLAADGRQAVLGVEVDFNYHHGADAGDPRAEHSSLAFTLQGLLVRPASPPEAGRMPPADLVQGR